MRVKELHFTAAGDASMIDREASMMEFQLIDRGDS